MRRLGYRGQLDAQGIGRIGVTVVGEQPRNRVHHQIRIFGRGVIVIIGYRRAVGIGHGPVKTYVGGQLTVTYGYRHGVASGTIISQRTADQSARSIDR